MTPTCCYYTKDGSTGGSCTIPARLGVHNFLRGGVAGEEDQCCGCHFGRHGTMLESGSIGLPEADCQRRFTAASGCGDSGGRSGTRCTSSCCLEALVGVLEALPSY